MKLISYGDIKFHISIILFDLNWCLLIFYFVGSFLQLEKNGLIANIIRRIFREQKWFSFLWTEFVLEKSYEQSKTND